MRIPDFYQNVGWQRFFSGIFVGSLVAWFIFLHMYGVLQEEQAQKIIILQDEIKDMKGDMNLWQQDYMERNKENANKLIIEKIKIDITNAEKTHLGEYSKFQIEESVKENIHHLVAKDIETAYQSREILKKAIENKIYVVNNLRYEVRVREILFFTTLSVNLEVTLLKG